ncbi:unknown [Ruminococcus sp. CAG:563]|nr:unknown [Ruminococcus sp. CAG:563]
MFKYFLNTLAISVSELEPVQKNDGDDKQKAIWIIALVAVIIICIVVSQIKFNISGKIKAKKEENAKKKVEKERNDELERLHEIKRKNQRK